MEEPVIPLPPSRPSIEYGPRTGGGSEQMMPAAGGFQPPPPPEEMLRPAHAPSRARRRLLLAGALAVSVAVAVGTSVPYWLEDTTERRWLGSGVVVDVRPDGPDASVDIIAKTGDLDHPSVRVDHWVRLRVPRAPTPPSPGSTVWIAVAGRTAGAEHAKLVHWAASEAAPREFTADGARTLFDAGPTPQTAMHTLVDWRPAARR